MPIDLFWINGNSYGVGDDAVRCTALHADCILSKTRLLLIRFLDAILSVNPLLKVDRGIFKS